jgi:hypothetical protein
MYASMIEVARANAEAGYHWFSKSTTRFFGSRVESGLTTLGDGTQLFISSEQYEPDTLRLYTIRQVVPGGAVKTFSRFQEYGTLDDAKAAVTDLLLAGVR